MSTRCTVHFTNPTWSTGPEAIIYRHSDGYPETMVPDLAEFFDAVKAQTHDTRFGDPSYLAAKYVVWLASQFAVKYSFPDGKFTTTPTAPLDFLSVGVMQKDPLDIEYRYVVKCLGPDVPEVEVQVP